LDKEKKIIKLLNKSGKEACKLYSNW